MGQLKGTLDVAAQIIARPSRHHHIADDYVRSVLLDGQEGGVRVIFVNHLIAGREQLLHISYHIRIVVHDEHGRPALIRSIVFLHFAELYCFLLDEGAFCGSGLFRFRV